MKVAFVGKGGAGKSLIAGTVARLLARKGHAVLAADSDPMPGLSISLGCGALETRIPDEAVAERPPGEEGPRFRLRPGLTAEEAVERYAVRAPDDVRLLQFGKLRGPAASLVRSQFAFREILSDLPDDHWSVVGDLPGGTRQPFFGWAGYARMVLVVVEPTATSLLSARRLARLAAPGDGGLRIAAVVSKARGSSDIDLARRAGLAVLAAVPWDDTVVAAERSGQALIDHAPGSPAVRALEGLADWFTRAEGGSYDQSLEALGEEHSR